MLEEALCSLAGCSIKVSKANIESPLTELEYNCPTGPDVFWNPVKKHMQNIMTHTQQLGMAQEFHSEDIKLLLEAATKDFL